MLGEGHYLVVAILWMGVPVREIHMRPALFGVDPEAANICDALKHYTL